MMFARSKLKKKERHSSLQPKKFPVRILSIKTSKRQKLAVCLREKMKRLLQGPMDKLSANHDSQVSPGETDADLFVCGVKRKSSSPDVRATGDAVELIGGAKPADTLCHDEVESICDASFQLTLHSEDQNGHDNAEQSSSSDEQTSELFTPPLSNGLETDQSTISITMSWKEITENNQLLCQNELLDPNSESNSAVGDRSADVIEYILKELQGISRIQAEIAELQQHLCQIKGSVEEVSTCVDSVLTEIEGLQVGCGSSPKPVLLSPSGQSIKDSNDETVLYFYGISEHEDENMLERIHCFLCQHHCFNGIQSREYIREAYRVGAVSKTLLGPRPTFVKFSHPDHREVILKRSVNFQSSGVRIVPFEEHDFQNRLRTNSLSVLQQGLKENRWSSLSLDKEVVRTDDTSCERKTESFRIRYQNKSTEAPCGAEEFLFAQKCTLAKKCSLSEGETARGQSCEQCCEKSVSHLCIRLDSQESQKNLLFANQPSTEKNACRVLTRSNHLSAEGEEAEIAIHRCCSIVDDHEGLGKDGDLVSCDSRVQFRSTEKINLIIKDPSGSFTSLSFDDTVDKCAAGTVAESLKEVVHIDLDGENKTGHVFRDYLNQPDENIDIVDIKFYANKLGKALNHFRSALKVAFNKLESPDTSFPVPSCDPIQTLNSVGSGHFNDSLATRSSMSNSYSSSSNLEDAYFVLNRVPSLPHEASIPSLVLSPDVDLKPPETEGFPEQLTEGGELVEGAKESKPMRLDQVCVETIYLNKCINNFKNVLREKKKMQRKLLKDIVQETFWVSGEEMTSGIIF
ncbi:uncharacterized protein PAF06_009876 [Gastrophryne carolinensis]